MKRAPSLRMVMVALVVSLGGSFHFGYHLVITNPSQGAFIQFLNTTLGSSLNNGSESTLDNVWSFSVAIIFLGALAGSFSIRLVADKVGRKRGLYVPMGIAVLSGGLSVASKFIPSFILYVISRITMGYSVSLSLGIAALFLTEASPKECRGSIGMITGTCVQFGTVVGSVLAMPQIFGTFDYWYLIYVSEMAMILIFAAFLPFLPETPGPKECRGSIGMITGTCVQFGTVVGSVLAMPQIFGTFDYWYLIYVSEMAMILIFAAFLPFLPETPGFLVQRGAHESAKKSLMFYYKCNEETAEQHLLNIKDEQKRYTKVYTMIDVMRKGSLRKKAMIGVIVTFAMSFSGVSEIVFTNFLSKLSGADIKVKKQISVINAFAVEILRGTGLSSLEASIANVGIAFVSMVAIVISSAVIDKFGRRPLLLLAFTGCLFCNLAIFALMFTFNKYGYTILGFILIFVICVFIIFFAIGPGPLCYFINAELVGQAARSGAQSWASVVQMLSRFVIVTIFLPMRAGIGDSWSYLILFVAPVIASIIYLYFCLPETKNKTALEVEEAMAKLPTIFTIRSRGKVSCESMKL
ncbi:transporter, major facilitator family protein [Oesophagostomum dentatum]|uniref:Transporter, major facilitator family protein n=1 Tax=Oesophagostomum dentatum TaxID=61180 RepID=A0A0B1TJ62_OESDE|nr:transporter, major facilitator family protein [Oesophagostomum dentatum]